MSETLKTVPLNDVHQQLGAKMVPFAGYNMPVRYSSDLEEHHTVRRAAGMFDVSHMGEFRVRGPQALPLIQRVCSNDASKLAPGKAQYSCLPNQDGGIVDDLLVYMLAEDDYLLVVNASNIEKDWNWIQQFNTEGADMQNVSDEMSLLAVQGPKAAAALQTLTDADLSAIPYYSFVQGTFAGAPDVIISATGYTGAGGFELYVPNAYAKQVWDAVMEAGQPYGLKPIGLGARDTLRLEMGYCLYGNDITDTTSPLEAGLGWITKFTKDFTNSESLKAQKAAGVERKLVGFLMDGAGIPRSHYPLVNEAGEIIGEVTSGTQSPSLSKGVGLGYVQTALAAPGTPIFVQVRGKNLPATVVKLPFVPGTDRGLRGRAARATPRQPFAPIQRGGIVPTAVTVHGGRQKSPAPASYRTAGQPQRARATRPYLRYLFLPELLPLFDLKGKVAVVVDVLRATSSIVTALAAGVTHLVPFSELAECRAMAAQGYLTAAERDGRQAEGVDLGNSPFGYLDGVVPVQGRAVAITTTNGTRALHLSAAADEIVVGAFLNLGAVADHLRRLNKDVVVVCAGWKGQFCLEDTLFGGALAARLAKPTSIPPAPTPPWPPSTSGPPPPPTFRATCSARPTCAASTASKPIRTWNSASVRTSTTWCRCSEMARSRISTDSADFTGFQLDGMGTASFVIPRISEH